jgi:hypothetical protein
MLLDQLADIRAALLNFAVPDELAQNSLHDRVFNFKPAKFTVPVAPTREFWMHVLATKIEATIRNPGDMIGWDDDEETVGQVASSAKKSLLSALPFILPPQDAGGRLYRHVLEHGSRIRDTQCLNQNIARRIASRHVGLRLGDCMHRSNLAGRPPSRSGWG